MTGQFNGLQVTGFGVERELLVTRRGVIERLADPYLTDHDRWVLGQFSRFLSGKAPHPDPRATRTRPQPRPRQPLYSRVRRATL